MAFFNMFKFNCHNLLLLVLRGRDPSLNVVILEDTAAVAGVVVASVCMGLTMLTNSPIPDAVGSLVIGGLLGIFFLFKSCIVYISQQ